MNTTDDSQTSQPRVDPNGSGYDLERPGVAAGGEMVLERDPLLCYMDADLEVNDGDAKSIRTKPTGQTDIHNQVRTLRPKSRSSY